MLGCAQGALTKYPCPYCKAQIEVPKKKKTVQKGVQKVQNARSKDQRKGKKQ